MTDLAHVYDAVLAKHHKAQEAGKRVYQFIEFEMTKFSAQGISSLIFRLGEVPGLSYLQLTRLFPSESNMYRLSFLSSFLFS